MFENSIILHNLVENLLNLEKSRSTIKRLFGLFRRQCEESEDVEVEQWKIHEE